MKATKQTALNNNNEEEEKSAVIISPVLNQKECSKLFKVSYFYFQIFLLYHRSLICRITQIAFKKMCSISMSFAAKNLNEEYNIVQSFRVFVWFPSILES